MNHLKFVWLKGDHEGLLGLKSSQGLKYGVIENHDNRYSVVACGDDFINKGIQCCICLQWTHTTHAIFNTL